MTRNYDVSGLNYDTQLSYDGVSWFVRPVISVKLFTGNTFIPPGGATDTNSTEVVGYVQGAKVIRGRQYELDTDQTGTLDLQFDNTDSGLAFNTDTDVGVPAQISATWNGESYTLWTGCISTITNNPRTVVNSIADISCVDGFDYLTNRQLRSHVGEAICAASEPPDFYFPMNDPVGTTTLVNSSLMSKWANAVGTLYTVGGGGTYAFGADGMCTNDSGTCFSVGNAANGVGGDGVAIEIAGEHSSSGYTVVPYGAWSACMIVSVVGDSNPSDGYAYQFSIEDSLSLDRYGNFALTVNPDGTISLNAAEIAITKTQVANGVPVCFGFDGTNAWVYCLGKYNASTDGPFGTTGVPVGNVITFGAFAQGESGAVFDGSWTGKLQHLAFWGSYSLTRAECAMITSAWGAFPNETIPARLSRIGTFCGLGALQQPTDNQENQTLVAQPEAAGSSALTVLQEAAGSALGRYFMNEMNQPFYSSRYHGQQAVTQTWELGQSDGVTFLYSKAPVFEIDSQYIYNDVQVTLQTGEIVERRNLASMAKYGQRLNQINTDVADVTNAGYMAGYIAGFYGSTGVRVKTVTLDPAADQRLWPLALGVKIDDLVKLTYTMMGGTTLTGMFLVQHIAHNIAPDTWTVDLELAPLREFAVIPSMLTTLTTAMAINTTTQFVMAPLPDAAYCPAEGAIAVGAKLVIDQENSNVRETITVASVQSQPTPNAVGYTSILVTATANNAHTHVVGSTVTDVITSGVTMDPTAGDFDSRMILDETAVLQW